MVTREEVGNSQAYRIILDEVKKDMPLFKGVFKKEFSKEEAQGIHKLILVRESLENLDFLKFLPNLKELYLDEVSGLRDINGLQYCLNLETLDIKNSHIEDLASVGTCVNLRYFGYYFEDVIGEYNPNGKMEFPFLNRLPRLEKVCLSNNRVRELSFMVGCNELRELILQNMPIITIAPLKHLPRLERLDLTQCYLEELEDIKDFSALKYIDLRMNSISEARQKAYLEKYVSRGIEFKFEDEHTPYLEKIKKNIEFSQADIENGRYSAYDLVDPFSDIVTLRQGIEVYHRDFAPYTEAQRQFFALIKYRFEVLGSVENTDHKSFLVDSFNTGMLWKDVIDGLHRIGAVEEADNFQKIIDLFGGSIPFDKEERLAVIENRCTSKWERVFAEANRFYDAKEELYPGKNLGELMDEYARKHASEFVLKGTFYYSKEDIFVDTLVDKFWKVNSLEEEEVLQKSLEMYPVVQRRLYAVYSYCEDASVCGHKLFLDCPKCVCWKDALEGMRMIGATKYVDNFKRLVDTFGGDIPLNGEKRTIAVEKLLETKGEAFFEELDAVLDDGEELKTILVEYMEQHLTECGLSEDIIPFEETL